MRVERDNRNGWLWGQNLDPVTELIEMERVDVGKHMQITRRKYDRKEYVTSDGFEFKKGVIVGRIDFTNNLPVLGPDDSLNNQIREFIDSAKASLIELAERCRENDEELEEVEGFYGYSHLASHKLAEVLGLEFGGKESQEESITGQINDKKGRNYVRGVAKNNKYWERYADNLKKPSFVYISRNSLVKLYAGQKK